MAETKEPEESTLPSKRKPDPSGKDGEEQPSKALKVENPQHSEEKTQETRKKDGELDVREEKKEDDGVHNGDHEEEDDDVDGNGEEEVEADRKGKGILIEEDDEEDDDDDSSDGGVQSDGDSDLSDDPLAEVDLDNILPSRTRRRVTRPGEFVANDLDDDSDTDDSDA